jgi:hypothetical protein
MRTVGVEFRCDRCGLLTPGFADLPDDLGPSRQVQLEHVCFHCGAELQMVRSIGELADKTKR